jgi:polysaccharide chain length determinant protein (PEP-CTERM system associated)
MQSRVHEFLEALSGAWRFRWQGIWVAWIVGTLGWVVVFFWPDMYIAAARVFVDTRTALKPVLQGLAVEQDVNGQLNYVSQSLLATPELEKIAGDTGLLSPLVTDPRARAKIIERMRDRVDINVRSAANLANERDTGGSVYEISYADRSRDRSLKVVDALLNALVQDTLGGKRQGSQDAQKFLEVQISKIELQLRAAEQRLADFKKNNVGVMPAERGGYFERLQAETDALRTTGNALSVAVSRRDEIRRQLRGESAVTATAASPTGMPGTQGAVKGGGDVLSRIAETQAKLDDLLLKFTDKHPDVIAARETLEELKRRREQEVEALRQGDPDAVAASGAGANPVYQSIQLALNQAELEIATLTKQGADHRNREAELRKALDTMPQVEAQFAQLNRDYDVNKTQFTALLTQLEKAKLGQEAEASGSIRFEIIEPTNADYRPKSPHRLIIIPAVLALALTAGAGVAYLRHRLTPVFWSSKTLLAVTGTRVLGVVSGAFQDSQRRKARRDLLWYSAVAGSLVLVAGAAVCASQLGLRFMLPPLG